MIKYIAEVLRSDDIVLLVEHEEAEAWNSVHELIFCQEMYEYRVPIDLDYIFFGSRGCPKVKSPEN